MATLDAHLTLPLPLVAEGIPTVAAHAASIEPWVIWHLKRSIEAQLHYENQLYGPKNTYLNAIFPLRRRFSVIPQAMVRRVMDPDEMWDDLGNVSFGSTGGLHESRILPGSETSKSIPDFMVVKVNPVPNAIREHHIVCVLEIKLQDANVPKAMEQMMEYMLKVADLQDCEENLQGFLVVGKLVKRYWLQGHQLGLRVQSEEIWFDMFAAGDRLTTELCEIAVDNWN